MTGYLVDTNWIIDCLYGRNEAIGTLVALASHGLAVSLMTYGELYQGAYYARDPRTALRGLRTFLQASASCPSTAQSSSDSACCAVTSAVEVSPSAISTC